MTELIRPAAPWSLAACAENNLVALAGPAAGVRVRLAAMVEEELPGVQYVVVDEHGVVFEAALGVRDARTGERMERDTLQMAYSMTKAITAVAVMQLVDEGKMELDRSLSAYFDEHPYGEAVTIRMLLAHTSGVPNPMPLDWFSVEGRAVDRDGALRALLAKHPRLAHEPGKRYSYSNLSYWLLEKAIERVSGEDFGDRVARRIFAPLSVWPENARFSLGEPRWTATGHSSRFSLMNLFVQCVSPREYWQAPSGAWSRAARVTPHGRGYGGLFTNALALSEVLRDLLHERPGLLSPEAKRELFARQTTRDGEAVEGTLGWVTGSCAGEPYFGKQGGGLGFHGNLRIYPGRGLATVLLANRTELSARPIDARSCELDRFFVSNR